jgi:hypothetical protein
LWRRPPPQGCATPAPAAVGWTIISQGYALVHRLLPAACEHVVDPHLYHTLLGNVGSPLAFRPGIDDAANVEMHFAPAFSRHDLLRLPNHHACARLLVDGRPAEPFTFETVLPAPAPTSVRIAVVCRERSRKRHGRRRKQVEADIAKRLSTEG